MKIALASLAAFALTAAAPAAAAKPETQLAAAEGTVAAAPATAASGKEAKKTCRRFDNTTSRVRGITLCLTREEWKKFEAEQD